MLRHCTCLLLLFLLLLSTMASAQNSVENRVVAKYDADSVRAELEKAPYFSLFKDNYFIGGIPIDEKPTKHNADVKFQLSVSQRLTRSTLPFDTYLFLQYTQKAFWNVLETSLPIRDLNFNPGFGIGHLIIHKNKYIGKGYLMIEHESNGKDGELSRSWNRLTLAVTADLSQNLQLQFKGWLALIDGRNNDDIQDYSGIFQVAGNLRTNNKRFNLGVVVTQRKNHFAYNSQVDLSFKFSEKDNQYIFLQYYNGYGENLLEYMMYKNVVRLGFVIKPRDFSIY